MFLYKKFILGVFFIFLYGCSSQGLHVTYDSSPRSARLVCNGIFQGYTPTMLTYSITEDNIKHGHITTVPCYAVWMSGATEAFHNVFPVNSDTHWYTSNVMSKTVSNVDIQFNNMREIRAMEERRNADAVIQQINQAAQSIRPITTHCNRYGTMTTCNSY